MSRLNRKDAASLRSWEDRILNEHIDPEPEEPETNRCDNCDQETVVSEFDNDFCGVCDKPYYRE